MAPNAGCHDHRAQLNGIMCIRSLHDFELTVPVMFHLHIRVVLRDGSEHAAQLPYVHIEEIDASAA